MGRDRHTDQPLVERTLSFTNRCREATSPDFGAQYSCHYIQSIRGPGTNRICRGPPAIGPGVPRRFQRPARYPDQPNRDYLF